MIQSLVKLGLATHGFRRVRGPSGFHDDQQIARLLIDELQVEIEPFLMPSRLAKKPKYLSLEDGYVLRPLELLKTPLEVVKGVRHPRVLGRDKTYGIGSQNLF